MTDHTWQVVPLSRGQREDVRPEDILNGGLYRRCETYRGGGGYDQFPLRARERWNEDHHVQFIVQLRGCNLDCPYCYVTRAGVWGAATDVSTTELVAAFAQARSVHNCTVFHLMGGAPALQLKRWGDLLVTLEAACKPGWVFHSDLMLSESVYRNVNLRAIAHPRALYAVDIKGLTPEEHLHNTRKPWNRERFWDNLAALEFAEVPFYFTFTACAQDNIAQFWDSYVCEFGAVLAARRAEESYRIKLIQYDATPYVDTVPWGWDGKTESPNGN